MKNSEILKEFWQKKENLIELLIHLNDTFSTFDNLIPPELANFFEENEIIPVNVRQEISNGPNTIAIDAIARQIIFETHKDCLTWNYKMQQLQVFVLLSIVILCLSVFIHLQ